jgi:hypothetical protein
LWASHFYFIFDLSNTVVLERVSLYADGAWLVFSGVSLGRRYHFCGFGWDGKKEMNGIWDGILIYGWIWDTRAYFTTLLNHNLRIFSLYTMIDWGEIV